MTVGHGGYREMARARRTARRTAGRKNGSTRAAGKRTAAAKARSGSRRAPRTTSARGAGRGGTDAVHVLKQQHDQARKLFQELAEATGEARRSTFQKLADALAAHGTVEERLVYPELARHEETGDLARDAVEEHLVQKRVLADMLESNVPEEVFDAKCRVLEDEVTRHIEEEEGILLPRAQKLLGRERLAELGPEIARTFGELMQHEPRRNLPREAEEGAPVLH